MSKSTTIASVVEASKDYPADPAEVERAKVYLRSVGSLSGASLVEFLQAMPDSSKRERSEAALAFLGVYLRGEW